jgi:AT hook motif
LYHQGCSQLLFSGVCAMAKVMLVSSRVEEIKGASFKRPLHNGKLDKRTMGDGFYVLREPRSDRGIRRKPEKIKPEGTGKRGRPRSHEELRPMFAESLRERGLVATQKWLANGGIPVSLTLLNAVAEEYGIVFAKGRPRKATAA